MNLHRAEPSTFYRTAGLLGVAACLAAGATVLLSVGGWESARGTRMFGYDRLVSSEPLPGMDGEMCELEPASPPTPWLRRASAGSSLVQQFQSPARSALATDAAKPSEAVRQEVAKRRPIRTLQDPYSAYAGIALDPVRNEVIMADENLFSLHVFDRMENTPPKAKMSEPKRMIHGENTFLEFACSVYVDPANGEIYAINNDTMNWMPVFGRDAKGDAVPVRKLATVTSAFGIVADEQEQVIFITIQRDHAVAVFKKTAKENDPAVRNIQGPRTLMADPHGLTLDTKTGLLYVTNWGSNNDRETPPSGNGKRNLPIGRDNSIPGSGRFEPPSITVYPKDANGDTPPVQVIKGPKTQLNWPTAVAVHPERGELFVANDSGDSVMVFPANATGDVAPIRVIKGPKSLIKNPTGVAVDVKNNELWVANFGTHAATVYKIDASGDAVPLRVIRSGPANAPTSMIGNPHTMAFDTKREELLVAN